MVIDDRYTCGEHGVMYTEVDYVAYLKQSNNMYQLCSNKENRLKKRKKERNCLPITDSPKAWLLLPSPW